MGAVAALDDRLTNGVGIEIQNASNGAQVVRLAESALKQVRNAGWQGVRVYIGATDAINLISTSTDYVTWWQIVLGR